MSGQKGVHVKPAGGLDPNPVLESHEQGEEPNGEIIHRDGSRQPAHVIEASQVQVVPTVEEIPFFPPLVKPARKRGRRSKQ